MDYLFLALLIVTAFASASFLRTKALTTVAFILVFAFWYICNMFTGNGVTDAVYYHLKINVTGTSIDDILPKIYAAIIFIFLCVIIIFASFKCRRIIPAHKPWVLNSIFIFCCVLTLTQSHAMRNVYNSFSSASFGKGLEVARNYSNINYKTDKKYNYVFIYARKSGT